MATQIRSSRGFTLIELLIVVAIVGFLAALAVPAFHRARMASHEASAIAGLRTINSSQHTYATTCTHGTFALTLDVLGHAPTHGGAAFLSPDLSASAVVKQDGYEFDMGGDHAAQSTPTNCQGFSGGEGQAAGYWAAATALSGTTGTRDFWTNTSRTIWEVRTNGDGISAFHAGNLIGPPTPLPSGAKPIQTGGTAGASAPPDQPPPSPTDSSGGGGGGGGRGRGGNAGGGGGGGGNGRGRGR